MGHTFKFQYDQNSPVIEFRLHQDSTIDQVLEAFKRYLLATGFESETVEEAFDE
jgi:hypothetical protein